MLRPSHSLKRFPYTTLFRSLPQTYLVDDQDGVKEPLGMSGVRLEVEVHLVTGATTSVRNVVRSVNRAGLQVQDIVLEPLRSEEHTSELQSRFDLVCRLLLEK